MNSKRNTAKLTHHDKAVARVAAILTRGEVPLPVAVVVADRILRGESRAPR